VLQRVRRGEFPRPRAVHRQVPPALEAVCLKAMALRPGQRYDSALALAEDVEHWLAGEPTGAWPEPWPARLRRWTRRHRTLAALALLLTATLGLGALAVLQRHQNHELKAARDREADARQTAADLLRWAYLRDRQESMLNRAGEAIRSLPPATRNHYQGRYDELQRKWHLVLANRRAEMEQSLRDRQLDERAVLGEPARAEGVNDLWDQTTRLWAELYVEKRDAEGGGKPLEAERPQRAKERRQLPIPGLGP
jgi:hypothetical protein